MKKQKHCKRSRSSAAVDCVLTAAVTRDDVTGDAGFALWRSEVTLLATSPSLAAAGCCCPAACCLLLPSAQSRDSSSAEGSSRLLQRCSTERLVSRAFSIMIGSP